MWDSERKGSSCEEGDEGAVLAGQRVLAAELPPAARNPGAAVGGLETTGSREPREGFREQDAHPPAGG